MSDEALISEQRYTELRQERLIVQKKTFTKWANIHLLKHGLQIDDLFQDLGDGKKLMKLLEIITGEKLGKPALGSSRISKIENVSRCLAFLLSRKMRLENISSEDIVDGKPHLILGLLWTIILRCEIFDLQENKHAIQMSETKTLPSAQKIAKDSLLLWCQTKTEDYPGVKIKDFRGSWRDGLGFNALIHSHLPSAVNFGSLNPHDHIGNLKNAFEVAEKFIRVPKLLDPEDIDTNNPDEKSIMIYVASFCKALASIKKGMTGGKRIANIIGQMMEIARLKETYEGSVKDLLCWINNTINDLSSTVQFDSLQDTQKEFVKFKEYRTIEKPRKYQFRNEIAALLFSIKTKLKALGHTQQSQYVPPEGTTVYDIEKAWSMLEKAEYQHESKLRDELKHQEKLENLAFKFEKKYLMCDGYLKDMKKVLVNPNYGTNFGQLDATVKKHEAIKAGIMSREDAIIDLFRITETLEDANYWNKDHIAKRREEIEDNWNYLVHLLFAYDKTFHNLKAVFRTLCEIDAVIEEIKEMEDDLQSYDAGCHSIEDEDIYQKLKLNKAQIVSWGDAINRIDEEINKCISEMQKEAPILLKKQNKLHEVYERLVQISASRLARLESSLRICKFAQDSEEERAWIFEKQLSCLKIPTCKDLSSSVALQQKHKALESEIKGRRELVKKLEQVGLKLSADPLIDQQQVQDILDSLNTDMNDLSQIWVDRNAFLEDVREAHQHQADANEAQNWIVQNLHLMQSSDYGEDELTSKALLRRHARLEEEISAYEAEIQKLQKEAEKISSLVDSFRLPQSKADSTLIRNLDPSLEYSGTTAEIRNEETKKMSENSITSTSLQNEVFLTKDSIRQSSEDIKTSYESLLLFTNLRRKKLEDASLLFRYNEDHEEVELWIAEKKSFLTSEDFKNGSKLQKKQFENCINDMASYNSRIEQLDKLVKEFEEKNHRDLKMVEEKNQEIKTKWNELKLLKTELEHELKGDDSLQFFYQSCDEAYEWMKEKLKSLSVTKFRREIKTMQALRRENEVIERELVPVQHRIQKLNLLEESVLTSFLSKRKVIKQKMQEIQEVWLQLQVKANDVKSALDDAVGFQIFKESFMNLMSWMKDVKYTLSTRDKVNGVSIAETLLKDHDDIGEDIVAHNEEISSTQELGYKLKKHDPDSEVVLHMIQQLENEEYSIHELWKEKGDWLRQCLDLQIFNREADQIDSILSSYESYLEYEDLGSTLDEVETLLKRHDSFINTIKAQDERLNLLKDMTDKLVQAGHYESFHIKSRCQGISEHHITIKESAQERKLFLLDSYKFQSLKADTNELSAWIAEKCKALSFESYKDFSNLQRRAKRHAAFEAELTANEDRLDIINSTGQALILESHFASDAVGAILAELNESWNSLCSGTKESSLIINQLLNFHSYSKSFESLNKKLDELEDSLQLEDLGDSLRNVKRILKEQQVLEADFMNLSERSQEMVDTGEKMIAEGNMESSNIQKLISLIKERIEKFKLPIYKRREALQKSLKFHELKFHIDREIHWINEHLLLVSSEVAVQNLLEAQKLLKRNENVDLEVMGHQPVIDKVFEDCQNLANDKNGPDVALLSEHLRGEWENLLTLLKMRKHALQLSLEVQVFYSEANEVEMWINETLVALANTDYGKDEDAVVKLLAKNKVLELEIDTYGGLVSELRNQAQALINSNHPEAIIVGNRMEVIEQEMKNVRKLSSIRRKKLLESKTRFEFLKETEELKEWIEEQMTIASSNDYGQDYEHLLELRSKFEFFQTKIEAGSKRVLQYEELSKKIMNSDCDFSHEVQKSLELLSERWSVLLECIDDRLFKMEAAGDIHRYNRDVCDLLSRIHEKYEIISVDIGRNLMNVQDLLKKHDNYENDLLAIEAKVQLLLDDSRQCQEKYPGGNADHIEEQITFVVENWNALQQKVAWRKATLLASYRLQKFLASARDYETWAQNLSKTLKSDAKGQSLESIKSLKFELDQTKNEIVANEVMFDSIIKEGKDICSSTILPEQDVFDQINKQVEDLENTRSNLHSVCERQIDHINECFEFQSFIRDVKQLETFLRELEVHLCSRDRGETIEDIEKALKHLLAFQKIIEIHKEKLTNLKILGEKLIINENFDGAFIQGSIDKLNNRYEQVKDLSAEKSKRLAESLLFVKFNQDAVEAELWISEKKVKLINMKSQTTSLSLLEKVDVLQKHQAFEAELAAHESNIIKIKEEGEILISRGVQRSSEVQKCVQNLLREWNDLVEISVFVEQHLAEARGIVYFNEKIEKAESWIKEKDLMVQAHETGMDYEHCLALLKKLDDVDSDLRIDESRIENINKLADKLITEGHSFSDSVDLRRNNLIHNWESLNQNLELYRKALIKAAAIHKFIKDVSETEDWIKEKNLILLAKEEVKDFETAKLLKRKQEILEMDITAIEAKIAEHKKELSKLIAEHPDSHSFLEEKIDELLHLWESLLGLIESRKSKLASDILLQKFIVDVNNASKWAKEMLLAMECEESAFSAEEAKQLLQLHQERKLEINVKEEEFDALIDRGNEFLQSKNLPADIVDQNIDVLEELKFKLVLSSEERKEILSQSLDFQIFLEKAKQVENWLSSKETFLQNTDVHKLDSPTSVEALIRKHDSFEKTMTVQMEKIHDLKLLSEDLIAKKNFESASIQCRCHAICEKQAKLMELCEARRKLLNDTKLFQDLLLDIHEIASWINQKMYLASDKSYCELSNQLSKIQKHSSFEAEILANHDRLMDAILKGRNMVDENHFASEEIQSQVDNLQQLWNKLLEETSIRRERLQDSYEALQFMNKLEELNTFLGEIEVQLPSDDSSQDLSSVKDFLRKFKKFQENIDENSEKLKNLKELAGHYQKQEHFLSAEIENQLATTVEKFELLQDRLQVQHESFNRIFTVLKLCKSADDEIAWIEKQKAICSSQDFGSNLLSVQQLQQKHKVLEAEIINHESVVSTIVEKSAAITANETLSANEIDSKIFQLQFHMQELKGLASTRKLKLIDALESETYYSEKAGAEVWMNEKLNMVSNLDFGEDVDTVENSSQQMREIKRDVEEFETTITNLKDFSHALIERNHFDSQRIQENQEKVECQYADLMRVVNEQQKDLEEHKKYYQILREISDVFVELKLMAVFTMSDDCGRDLEHAEILLQKFENVSNKLKLYEETVQMLKHSAQSLIDDRHSEAEIISKKMEEVMNLWEEIRASSVIRLRALEEAKLVHMFDKSATDTLEWINEKSISLSSEDYGHDLKSAKALLKQHEITAGDLKAISEQVNSLEQDASELTSKFLESKSHIEAKMEEVSDAWSTCMAKSHERKKMLLQAEEVQVYFGEYRDLMTWLTEMKTIITSYDLPQDVKSAESLIDQHKEHKSDIGTHVTLCNQFVAKGENFIDSGHFMSEEIRQKVNDLNRCLNDLHATWDQMQAVYEQNLELQAFERDAKTLDSWLQSRESVLQSSMTCDSIEEIEDLIRQHQDFEKNLELYEDKFLDLKRITKLEESALREKMEEEQKRQAEEEQVEKERLLNIKNKEQQRLIEERQREREIRVSPTSRTFSDSSEDDYLSYDLPEYAESVFKRIDSTRFGSKRSSRSNSSKPETKTGTAVNQAPKEIKESRSYITEENRPNIGSTHHMPLQSPSNASSSRILSEDHRSPSLRSLPPSSVAIKGFLERKRVLESGGKLATSRQWKKFYTILCGQLLCFFKDEVAFAKQNAAKPPENILSASCVDVGVYKRRKHVFRLLLRDKSEFLFMAANNGLKEEWINKLNFNASLSPRKQLQEYRESVAPGNTNARIALTSSDEKTYKRMPSIDSDYNDCHVESSASFSNSDNRGSESLCLEKSESSALDHPPNGIAEIPASSDKERIDSASPEIFEDNVFYDDLPPVEAESGDDDDKHWMKARSTSLHMEDNLHDFLDHSVLKKTVSAPLNDKEESELAQKYMDRENSSSLSTPSISNNSLCSPFAFDLTCSPSTSSRSSYVTVGSLSDTSTLRGQEELEEDWYSAYGENIDQGPPSRNSSVLSRTPSKTLPAPMGLSHHLSLDRNVEIKPPAPEVRGGTLPVKKDRRWKSMLSFRKKH